MFRLLRHLVAGVICSLLLCSCASIKPNYVLPVKSPESPKTAYRAAILHVKNSTGGDYLHPSGESNSNFLPDEKAWRKSYTNMLYAIVVNSGLFKQVEILDDNANVQKTGSNYDVIFRGEMLEIMHGGKANPLFMILPTSTLFLIGIPTVFGYEYNRQRFAVEAYIPSARKSLWSFDSGSLDKESSGWVSLWGINGITYSGRPNADKITAIIASKLENSWQNAIEHDFQTQLASVLADANSKTIVFKTEELATTVPDRKAVSFDGAIDFGKYHAIIIGIDQYRDLPALRTAVSDAQSIAAMLNKDYGFKVNLVLNPTRSQILDELARARQTLTENDNLLIYYAGHGWLDNGADQGYWMPADASRNSKANWISNTDVTSEILGMSSKHVMVVADSCYSGKLTRGFQIKELTPDYMTRMARKKARVVLSSGGLEPVADNGGKGKHSVFATAFMGALLENNGALDGTSLFTKIRHPVMVNSDQTPEYSDIHKAGHDGGDFIFVRKTAAAK